MRREGRREEDQMYGNYDFGMEFVKFCMEKYGFLYTSMDAIVCMEKSNHKPIFFL